MKILGIDPGSRITGYGIIKSQGNKHIYLASGCIKAKALTMPERLQQIHASLREIIIQYQPTTVAIEEVFLYKNPQSALKLGQARGVAMVACADAGLEVFEYSPRKVKQSVVGYGGATKDQIQHMVKVLLNLSGTPQVDAADALAIAICHSHFQGVLHTN